MAQSKAGHIFISYSHSDDEIAKQLISFLGERGIKVWIDHQGLIPGDPSWEIAIEAAIRNAILVIVILSPDANASKWVRNEISFADVNRTQIIPILADGDETTSVPIRLIGYQFVDIRKDINKGLDSLESAIRGYKNKVAASLQQEASEAAVPAARRFEQSRRKIESAAHAGAVFRAENSLVSAPTRRAAYSDRMAWTLAKMAKLAYIEFDKHETEMSRLKLNLKNGGFDLLKTFTDKYANAFLTVSRTNSYSVLAFRGAGPGSNDDIRTVLQINRIDSGSGGVHFGFSRAYATMAMDLEKQLADIRDYPLYITGHSTGAAIATIATQQIELSFEDLIAACYTFGSPRVGNVDYEMVIKSPIYRVVNAADIVPLLPYMSMGYVHIGDVRFLTRGGELRHSIPAFSRFLSILGGMLLLSGPIIRDHAIDEYIRKLEKIAVERNRDIMTKG
jgi:hypothetical protein